MALEAGTIFQADHDVRQPIRRSQVTVTALIDCFAGTVGGIACVLASQPLDTVKVKLQTYPEQYPRGMIECTVRTFKQGGMRGLYAGTLPNLVAQIAENATLFMFYGLSQKLIQKITRQEGDVGFLAKASSGSVAAVFVSFVLTPTELIKCQLQASREAQLAAATLSKPPVAAQKAAFLRNGVNQVILPTAMDITRSIWKREGFRGFFRGLVSTLVREVPGYFFFFAGYEGSKHFLIDRYQQNSFAEQTKAFPNVPGEPKHETLRSTYLRTMVCGGVAGVLFWSVMFPVDVVKSRIQTGRTDAAFVACFRDIVKKEGAMALYNGFGSALLRTIPASAFLFLGYEFTKQHMSRLLLL